MKQTSLFWLPASRIFFSRTIRKFSPYLRMHYSFHSLAPALLTAVSLFGAHSPAASQTTIPITTARNVLLLRADKSGNLNTVYFGEKLADSGEYEKVNGDALDLLAAAYTPS